MRNQCGHLSNAHKDKSKTAERSRNHERKESEGALLGSWMERQEGEGGHAMRASGSNDGCQDELAQLGFVLARKAVGKVGRGRESQKRGLAGTERVALSQSPAVHWGFSGPELQVLAKVCAGQLGRSEQARQGSQLVNLSSHNSGAARGGESWEWLRSTCH